MEMRATEENGIDLKWADHSYFNIGLKSSSDSQKSAEIAKEVFGKSDHCYHSFYRDTETNTGSQPGTNPCYSSGHNTRSEPGENPSAASRHNPLPDVDYSYKENRLSNGNLTSVFPASSTSNQESVISDVSRNISVVTSSHDPAHGPTNQSSDNGGNLPLQSGVCSLSAASKPLSVCSQESQPLFGVERQESTLCDLSNSPVLKSAVVCAPNKDKVLETSTGSVHPQQQSVSQKKRSCSLDIEPSGNEDKGEASTSSQTPGTSSQTPGTNKKRIDHSYCCDVNTSVDVSHLVKKPRTDTVSESDHTYMKRTRSYSCEIPSGLFERPDIPQSYSTHGSTGNLAADSDPSNSQQLIQQSNSTHGSTGNLAADSDPSNSQQLYLQQSSSTHGSTGNLAADSDPSNSQQLYFKPINNTGSSANQTASTTHQTYSVHSNSIDLKHNISQSVTNENASTYSTHDNRVDSKPKETQPQSAFHPLLIGTGGANFNFSLNSISGNVAIPLHQSMTNLNLQNLPTEGISVTPFKMPVKIINSLNSGGLSAILPCGNLGQGLSGIQSMLPPGPGGFQSAPCLLQVDGGLGLNIGQLPLFNTSSLPEVSKSTLSLPATGDLLTTALPCTHIVLEKQELDKQQMERVSSVGDYATYIQNSTGNSIGSSTSFNMEIQNAVGSSSSLNVEIENGAPPVFEKSHDGGIDSKQNQGCISKIESGSSFNIEVNQVDSGSSLNIDMEKADIYNQQNTVCISELSSVSNTCNVPTNDLFIQSSQGGFGIKTDSGTSVQSTADSSTSFNRESGNVFESIANTNTADTASMSRSQHNINTDMSKNNKSVQCDLISEPTAISKCGGIKSEQNEIKVNVESPEMMDTNVMKEDLERTDSCDDSETEFTYYEVGTIVQVGDEIDTIVQVGDGHSSGELLMDSNDDFINALPTSSICKKFSNTRTKTSEKSRVIKNIGSKVSKSGSNVSKKLVKSVGNLAKEMISIKKDFTDINSSVQDTSSRKISEVLVQNVINNSINNIGTTYQEGCSGVQNNVIDCDTNNPGFSVENSKKDYLDSCSEESILSLNLQEMAVNECEVLTTVEKSQIPAKTTKTSNKNLIKSTNKITSKLKKSDSADANLSLSKDINSMNTMQSGPSRKVVQAVISDHTYEEDVVSDQQVSIQRDHTYGIGIAGGKTKKKSDKLHVVKSLSDGKLSITTVKDDGNSCGLLPCSWVKSAHNKKSVVKTTLDIYNIDHNYEPLL